MKSISGTSINIHELAVSVVIINMLMVDLHL